MCRVPLCAGLRTRRPPTLPESLASAAAQWCFPTVVMLTTRVAARFASATAARPRNVRSRDLRTITLVTTAAKVRPATRTARRTTTGLMVTRSRCVWAGLGESAFPKADGRFLETWLLVVSVDYFSCVFYRASVDTTLTLTLS